MKISYQPLGNLKVGQKIFNTIDEIKRAYVNHQIDGSLEVIDTEIGYICNVKDL